MEFELGLVQRKRTELVRSLYEEQLMRKRERGAEACESSTVLAVSVGRYLTETLFIGTLARVLRQP